MIIIRKKGGLCKQCGEFSKKFIVCEVCKRRVCTACAGSDNFCKEHMLIKENKAIVHDYFNDKYGVLT